MPGCFPFNSLLMGFELVLLYFPSGCPCSVRLSSIPVGLEWGL